MAKIILISVFSMLFGSASAKFSCMNDQNEPVPWFTGYKIPELKAANKTKINEGIALMILDGQNSFWNMLDATVDQDQGHHVAHTVQQFYGKMPKDHFILMYNDEKPDGNVSFTRGHAKGMVLFDKDQGFWLIHSVPKFPPADRYEYPHSGHRYGQSFLCITFPSSELTNIAKQILYLEPYIYAGKLAGKLKTKHQELNHVLHQYWMIHDAPFTRVTNLTSIDGTVYTHFSKSHKFGKDLYGQLVAPTLDVSMDVETWRNGGGDLPPWCNSTSTPVRDVETMFFHHVGVEFRNCHDHSKWAVASRKDLPPWICIGDINRQIHQLKRGGGTMCQSNRQVWQRYQEAVRSTDLCEKNRPPMPSQWCW